MYTIARRPYKMRAYDPFREFEALQRRFFTPEQSMVSFGTDILDDGDSYRLVADLPGFKKEDINISVEGDRLCISAERKQENEENKDGYLRRERSYGSYSRCFDISAIEADGISGSYADGVLTLTLPKRAELGPAQRRIELS